MPIKRSYTDHGDACATAHAMELLGDRWTYPILRELMLAPKRYVELAEGVRGVAPATLAARLRDLQASGLVERIELPAPVRATAYQATGWARELVPVFQALGRWAQASPVWQAQDCGLTPDATVQSMLTMAPPESPDEPVELELWLHDGRQDGSSTYTYLLHWDDELEITRSATTGAPAVVVADSSTWAGVLYDGVPLDQVEVQGEFAQVRRVVDAFASLP